ncbi:MAG: nicotinamide-nucleotide adenylyltransferase [Candidatus Aenigmarchaeota archaeon]|nr:nicotinamide-nucleotide adenylyltransferase [Candidatus Aenigmarchaeota archaeon]
MIGLFIGRFQPFHKGHLKFVLYALSQVDKLIIGIGSSQEKYTEENPFTAEERADMIERTLKKEGIDKKRYEIIQIPDIRCDEKWVSHVKNLTPKFDIVYCSNPRDKKLFEEAGYEVREIGRYKNINATAIREEMLKDGKWEELVPEPVIEKIREIDGVRRVKEIN